MNDLGISVFIAAPVWPYLVFGFVVGTIPFGLIVGRMFFGHDIRAVGSGNIGAANALRTLGRKAGIAVLLLDALKGAAAVVAAANHVFYVAPPEVQRIGAHAHVTIVTATVAPLAGLAAILGHCYTPWLRFRGGKGVATFLGAAFALSWESGVAFILVWLAVVIPLGFSSLGSMLGTLVVGVILGLTLRNVGPNAWIFAAAASAVILWRHRQNIGRLVSGSENRLSLRRR
ncbi:MAG: glycerol-3-phosphate 1-O-acyltransferase PlsY [Candidatus Eremiobacteraeota bacterium]|nr:glycerol-3-phosphate 1-O-acyltransferase PlsY [Candidatus Eremiobacteraeota bacterium]MBC5801639.1 glycerol-3-phosphate 1-O-acyltransferase PlsY [Candidatus Eremiobacteraeota bacterium]MBC5822453.1 glycerol-3-phosphate 1-O-acyltransferase PlsY [Candidatus Eremiobacteraeota bacterium]